MYDIKEMEEQARAYEKARARKLKQDRKACLDALRALGITKLKADYHGWGGFRGH